jgi:hypothetical protein
LIETDNIDYDNHPGITFDESTNAIMGMMSKAEFEKLLGGEQPHRIEHRCTRMTTQAQDYRRSSVCHDQEGFRLGQT